MNAYIGRKYRLYPDAAQAERLTSWSHTARALWNVALTQRVWAYHSAKRVTLQAMDQGRELTAARAEFDWLRDLPAQCGQHVLRQLDAAYANFWNADHPAGFPQIKRKVDRQGVTFPAQAIVVKRVSRRIGLVRLPRIGWVRFRWSRMLGGEVHNVTVHRDGLGWHASFAVRQPEVELTAVNMGPAVGMDVGIACSVFLSTERAGRQRPASLSASEKQRLVGLERRRSRQMQYARRHAGGQYSNRLRTTLAQIAQLRARQARRRCDWNHKLTAELAKNHGLIAVEDLRVSNMMRSARGSMEQPGVNVRQKAGLNRSIADQGWFELRAQLGYKTKRHGSELVAVPAAGTSQTCNRCGIRDPESRKGCGRLFACVHCGYTEHADRNAALNILDRGLKMSTAGQAGLAGSGPGEPQSTRSPKGRGASSGTRMREPAPGSAA